MLSAMAAPALTRAYTVLRLLACRASPVGGDEYLVEWAGYPPEQASWEPESNISPLLVEGFQTSTVDPLTSASIAARATLAEREVTASERDLLMNSQCPLPKQWQSKQWKEDKNHPMNQHALPVFTN